MSALKKNENRFADIEREEGGMDAGRERREKGVATAEWGKYSEG